MMPKRLAAFAALLVLPVTGCGSTRTVTRTVPAPAPVAAPVQSICLSSSSPHVGTACTPDGAKPAAPPLRLLLAHGVSIDAAGLHLIEQFEGYRRCAYWDPFGGVWTVGFGQTRGISAGFCFPIRHGDNGVTAATANLKASVIREYEWAVHAIGYPFKQNAVDALDSFAYNLGAGIFTDGLRAALRAGHFRSAAAIMRRYVHAGGQVLAGLVTRRRLETQLLLTPEPKPKRTRAQLLTRRRVLRRVLWQYGCDRRRDAHHKLGKRCARWFRERHEINRELG